MIRGLCIIMMSVVLSAVTCIGIMMRYAHVSMAEVWNTKQGVRQIETSKDSTPAEAGVVPPPDPLVVALTDPACSVQPRADLPEPNACTGRFDYRRLNADLTALSQALQRFNEIIAREINRLKTTTHTAASGQDGSAS